MKKLRGVKKLLAPVVVVALVGTLLLAALAPALVQAQFAYTAAIECVKYDDEGICIKWAVRDEILD